MTWTIKLEEDKDTGDLILPLSDEIMKEAGWKIGDKLRWIDMKDGSWMLQRVHEQLDLFDEKDEAVLALLKENHALKEQVKNLTSLIEEYKNTYDIDDWK